MHECSIRTADGKLQSMAVEVHQLSRIDPISHGCFLFSILIDAKTQMRDSAGGGLDPATELLYA